jgi:hypothetical protein
MRRAVVAIIAVGFAGCTAHYLKTNYDVGQTIEATIGSPLLRVESGERNKYNPDVIMTKHELQLIYGGMTGSIIKVAYREFGNDLARPAFSQELQYDLQQSDTIAFQAIRLKVLKATNEKISVMVLSDGGQAVAAKAALKPARKAQPMILCESGADCVAGGVCIDGGCR